jgi:hypothetical protein
MSERLRQTEIEPSRHMKRSQSQKKIGCDAGVMTEGLTRPKGKLP